MERYFTDGRCCCGSANLATFVEWPGAPIPAGIDGFIGCRDCQRWQHRLTMRQAAHIHDDAAWTVIAYGQGVFHDVEGYAQVVIWENPLAPTLPRYQTGRSI